MPSETQFKNPVVGIIIKIAGGVAHQQVGKVKAVMTVSRLGTIGAAGILTNSATATEQFVISITAVGTVGHGIMGLVLAIRSATVAVMVIKGMEPHQLVQLTVKNNCATVEVKPNDVN